MLIVKNVNVIDLILGVLLIWNVKCVFWGFFGHFNVFYFSVKDFKSEDFTYNVSYWNLWKNWKIWPILSPNSTPHPNREPGVEEPAVLLDGILCPVPSAGIASLALKPNICRFVSELLFNLFHQSCSGWNLN